jgi:CubicO group peptidase (beta-lactamase class C family)
LRALTRADDDVTGAGDGARRVDPRCTRRAALAALGAAAVARLVAPVPALAQGGARTPAARTASADGIPISGRALPGLEALDDAVTPILHAHGIPGASIAITHGGALKLARGYGYADMQSRAPMRAETFVALASVSKVLTAQTILKLVEGGRIKLSDRVFGWFRDLAPPPGMREDPRLSEVTIEMCLHHTGGWDRKTSGDPSGWGPRISRALRLDRPPLPLEMIRYMKGVPLDFAPGTKQVYSNFGFVLLGGVIAAVARQPYPDAVRQLALQPMGATGIRLDNEPPQYNPGEAHRYIAGNEHPVPGGNARMVMASGGWQANCVDMARVMTAIDGSRTGTPFLSPPMFHAMLQPAPGIVPASPAHWMGLGWDIVQSFPDPAGADGKRYSWGKDGGLGGIQTYVEHLAIGANFVLLFNSAPQGDEGGALALVKPKVVEFVQQMRAWPDGDLFQAFRPA